MTNYEKIMQDMTIDKLVKTLSEYHNFPCRFCAGCDFTGCSHCKDRIKKWLEEEAM